MGNIIVIGLIVIILVFIFIKIKKDNNEGGCSSCPKGCSCSKKNNEQ